MGTHVTVKRAKNNFVNNVLQDELKALYSVVNCKTSPAHMKCRYLYLYALSFEEYLTTEQKQALLTLI